MGKRILLAVVLCGPLAACSPGETTAVPGVGPFRRALPEIELGVRLADLRARRPGLGMAGDGTYREEVEDLDVEYGFWPKEPERPPPLGARLMAIEVREEVYDTLRLRAQWLAAVSSASKALAREPDCSLLHGGRTRMRRASFGGKIRFTVTAEVWITEDGQDFGAFLITRAQHADHDSPRDAGLESQALDCDTVGGG